MWYDFSMFFRRNNKGITLETPRTLISERLLLKQYNLKDWQPWVEKRVLSRESVQPWEPFWADDVLTMQSFEKRVQFNTQSWDNGTGYFFLVWNRETNDLIGGISLSRVLRGAEQSATLGYWCSVDQQRQGYTYEAIIKVIEFAFGSLGLNRLQATCMLDNTASNNLLLKAGFKQEGLLRDYLQIQGKWEDHLIFGLLKKDIFS